MTETEATIAEQLHAILHRAAVAPITDRGFIRITGPDATRWLNGMVTNNIKDLQPGQGNYNFLLNAQGRIQGDCTIYREPGDGEATYLLETQNSQLETVQQTLDRFIIMDDVELTPGMNIEGSRVDSKPIGLNLTGPAFQSIFNKSLVGRREVEFTEIPKPGSITLGSLEGHEVVVLTAIHLSGPTYGIWCWNNKVLKELYRIVEYFGAAVASPEALEAFRIYSGTPKYGIDIRDKDLPQETAQTHALNFNKGCYLGQEIVERIHSRGQVHRTFTRFTLTGTAPIELPAPIEANGKPAGEITSVAHIGDTLYALGYARREALDTHATLAYPGGTAVPLIPNP